MAEGQPKETNPMYTLYAKAGERVPWSELESWAKENGRAPLQFRRELEILTERGIVAPSVPNPWTHIGEEVSWMRIAPADNLR